MNKALIILFVMAIIGLAIYEPSQTPALASYFLVCKVNAHVDFFNEETNTYGLIVKDSKVETGHEETGAQCATLEQGKLYEVDAALIGADLPIKQDVELSYHYYNGKGSKGIVEHEEWKLWSDNLGAK